MSGGPPTPPHRRYPALALLIAWLVLPQAAAIGLLVAAALGTGVLAAVRHRRAARHMRVGLLRAARTTDPAGAVSIGATAGGEPILLTDRQLSAHGLIVGASGSGKSTTMLTILTDHVRRGRPVVAIDLKGSPAFAAALARAAEGAGRRFAIWSPDGPAYWNPLAHGNPTELKDKLIAAERFTEPHYQRAAERYVQTVLQVIDEAPERTASLATVVSLMEPQRLATSLRSVPAALRTRVRDYIASLTPDQLSAIRGLGTRLAIISESHTGRYLEQPAEGAPAIDIRSALAGDQVVLFSLNSGTYGKLAAQLGTLAIQDLVSAAGHRLELPRAPRALIGIDEFSALGADNVIALLARGREAGLSVLLATQELADLDRAGPGLRDQVLGNTAVKIAHRQDVPRSAQTVSQMVGTEKIWEETYQLGKHPLFGSYNTGRGTRREGERFIVHPNTVKTLPTGHAVMITKLPVARARTVQVSAPRHDDGRER